MPTLRRAALVGLTLLLVAAVARAQTAPPPATLPPPAVQEPQAPPSAAPPPAAPAPATTGAPVQPLGSTMAPEPAPGPALRLTDRPPADQQAPRPEPFYRKNWFWAVVAVAFVTGFVITFVTLRDK